jgi:uncharacterized DUF497 family protein
LKKHIVFQDSPAKLPMQFTWDPKKEAANLEKHGVSFPEAQRAFDDPFAVVAFDEAHSPRGGDELRWWVLGKVGSRVMLVRYTHRPNGFIRIIGAGYWEIGATIYEKENRAN